MSNFFGGASRTHDEGHATYSPPIGAGQSGGGNVKYASLFTGIGGFDLGFDRAGMDCAWQCEREPNCDGNNLDNSP